MLNTGDPRTPKRKLGKPPSSAVDPLADLKTPPTNADIVAELIRDLQSSMASEEALHKSAMRSLVNAKLYVHSLVLSLASEVLEHSKNAYDVSNLPDQTITRSYILTDSSFRRAINLEQTLKTIRDMGLEVSEETYDIPQDWGVKDKDLTRIKISHTVKKGASMPAKLEDAHASFTEHPADNLVPFIFANDLTLKKAIGGDSSVEQAYENMGLDSTTAKPSDLRQKYLHRIHRLTSQATRSQKTDILALRQALAISVPILFEHTIFEDMEAKNVPATGNLSCQALIHIGRDARSQRIRATMPTGEFTRRGMREGRPEIMTFPDGEVAHFMSLSTSTRPVIDATPEIQKGLVPLS